MERKGNDTAIFNYSRSAYTVRSIDASGIVTIASSQEGTDRLVDVELYSFADGLYTIDRVLAQIGDRYCFR